jgi:hypothetical protein
MLPGETAFEMVHHPLYGDFGLDSPQDVLSRTSRGAI